MRLGSLFSGCGGLELGLEAAIPNLETVWQVEKDPYARSVLAKHWPNAKRYEDVKTVGARNLEPVDVLCGGFPCQDLSVAGRGGGLSGERSGLWWEMYRIFCELEPRALVIENVPALTNRGLSTILGALAETGYDAEWDCISAASQGAWHRRSRLFIIAYSNSKRGGLEPVTGDRRKVREIQTNTCHDSETRPLAAATTYSNGEQIRDESGERSGGEAGENKAGFGDDGEAGRVAAATTKPAEEKHAAIKRGGWWAVEPSVGRVAHGVPKRVDRLRLLGNAVVPQVAYQVGLRVADLLIEAGRQDEGRPGHRTTCKG